MSTTTTLQSSGETVKDNARNHSYFRNHTSKFVGRHLSETIEEEEEMSDVDDRSVMSGEGSEEGEYDTEDTQTGNGHGNGIGGRYGETAASFRDEGYPERPAISSETRLSSWADLDLSVVVALVSPIGQWLTGGDHIKNLFLIVLLIFYLHQLIQVPWELYHASLPRRRPISGLQPRAKDTNSRLLRLAQNELQTHEGFYLLLTVISPLLGAMFLRFILASINGADQISWFSTTLFVLATGMRPWSHLIDRLRQRTRELHDTIHYPSPESAFSAMRKLETAIKRIDSLQLELNEVKSRVVLNAGVEEVYDDLNGGLEEVEMAIRRNERKLDAAKTAQDKRLAALEKNLAFLLEERRRNMAPGSHRAEGNSIVSAMLAVRHALWLLVVPGQRQTGPEIYMPEKQQGKRKLETIPEDPLDVPEQPAPPSHPSKSFLKITISPLSLIGLAVAALTWPLRVFISVCLAIQRLLPSHHHRSY